MNQNGIVIGKYGEKFFFSKLPNGNYILSLHDIHYMEIEDLILDKKTLDSLLEFYTEKGCKASIHLEDRNELIERATNLGRKLFNEYNDYRKYQKGNSIGHMAVKLCSDNIKTIINDVKTFKLSDKDFIDLFITAGSTPEVMLEDKSIVSCLNYYYYVMEYLTDGQLQYLQIDYVSKLEDKYSFEIGFDGFTHCRVSSKNSGLPIDFFIDSLGKERIKSKYNYKKTKYPNIVVRNVNKWIYISIEDKPRILNKHNGKTLNDFGELKKYIIKNKGILLKHWNKELDEIETLRELKK